MPEEEPKIETLTERIRRYLREVKPPEEEVDLTWKEKIGLGLFSKVADFFSIMWKGVFESFRKALSGIVEDIFKFFITQFVTTHTARSREKLKAMYDNIGLPEDRKIEFYEEIDKDTPFDHVQAYFYAVVAGAFKIISTMSASHEKGRQEANALLQPSLPGLGDIFTATFREPKYEAVVDDYMKKMGFNEEVRTMIKLVRWILLNPDQIKQLYLRGKITKLEKNTMLKALGLREEDLDKLEELYYFIPSPTDLVRMAVREAFYPDYIAKYNLLAEYPPEFEMWAKKQGMSPEWSKKFWVSHWVLPSIMQGYEMLHRGVISKTDLDSLFKAVDIAPYWREKLLAISYSPYTRLDIRRM